ncbi:hypothetical protein HOY80DRAFT_226100 [Tuber brumale]|nr:hypothetical protein HOY80DRAFT_226100 [Tuber brumale]
MLGMLSPSSVPISVLSVALFTVRPYTLYRSIVHLLPSAINHRRAHHSLFTYPSVYPLPFFVRRSFPVIVRYSPLVPGKSPFVPIELPFVGGKAYDRGGGSGSGRDLGRQECCSAAGVFVEAVFLLLAGIRSGDLRGGVGKAMDGYGDTGKRWAGMESGGVSAGFSF